MTKREQVFVAYPGRDPALAAGIMAAVRKANSRPTPLVFEPWPFNDVAGTPLVSPILEKIDDSPLLVADTTYLNLNVVYEIGFAIGRSKRAFLTRHRGTEGDRATAKLVGIFDTLGYFEYDTFEDLQARLEAHIDTAHLNFSTALDRKSPIYLIEPPKRGPDVGVMVSRIKKAGYGRYRSFTPEEDTRLSATDAIRQVAASSGVFIPFQRATEAGAEVHNIRCMFIGGLCDGMGKPKLLLGPPEFEAPLDVRDDVKQWHQLSDIHTIVADFSPQIVEYAGQVEPSGIDRTTLLQSLSIGDPRAENEMNTLDQYYLKIDQFDRAISGEVNLVVGRKGSGKTALFIRLRDKMRGDRRNIVLDLKPEGYQLIRMKEDILEFLSEGARQHLIIAFWEYLIYLEIAYKLLEKDQKAHRYNQDIHDAYQELSGVYNAANFSPEGDFSERLSTLSDRLTKRLGDETRPRSYCPACGALIDMRDLSQILAHVHDT